MSKRTMLLAVLLLAVAGIAAAADAPCPAVAGSYVMRVSGFSGGFPALYPVAVIGNFTVADNGDVKGNYKQSGPYASLQVTKDFTGTLKVSSCAGTFDIKDGTKVTHHFNVLVGKDGLLSLAFGDNGVVLSGDARQ